jgi:aspartyl protease family protein
MVLQLAAMLLGFCLSLAPLQTAVAQGSVDLEALLGKTAVLMIDGRRHTLRVGESADGVTLVATEPTSATVQIAGRTQVLGLTRRVGTAYQARDELVVTIARDGAMQYQTSATINGRSAMVLVDTGANVMAISSDTARALGINYEGGEPSMVETAGGRTTAHAITLQSVAVGEIEVNNVPAMVVDGAFPTTILLGMSYLRHVKLQEHNGILSLSKSP